MSNADWVEVYRAENVIEATMLCDALKDEGVPALIDGEWLANSAGALPLGWSTLPRILCPPEVAEKARELLEKFESEELHGDGDSDAGDDDWEDEAEQMPKE